MSPSPKSPDAPAATDGAGPEGPVYIGLATRVTSFVIDAVVITVVAIIAEVAGALILSLLHLPKEVNRLIVAIGGVAYVVWLVGYFVAFWSGTGQTPGARVLQIRVVTSTGGKVKPRQALLRCIGVFLAALPLFAGYVMILFDSRRRGFQDRLARTLVVEAPQLSLAETQRVKRRLAYESSRQAPEAEPVAGSHPGP